MFSDHVNELVELELETDDVDLGGVLDGELSQLLALRVLGEQVLGQLATM